MISRFNDFAAAFSADFLSLPGLEQTMKDLRAVVADATSRVAKPSKCLITEALCIKAAKKAIDEPAKLDVIKPLLLDQINYVRKNPIGLGPGDMHVTVWKMALEKSGQVS